MPAPSQPTSSAKLSVSFPGELARLYAYGPKETSWSREGRAQLRFFDPFSPRLIRSTAPTRQLFPSSNAASAALGFVDRTTSFRAFALDPGGETGVFLLRTRQQAELYGFSQDRPIQHFAGARELSLRNLKSAVVSQKTTYAGFLSGREFTVVRLGPSALEKIVVLDLGEGGPRGIELVRTTTGRLGVALMGDAGLLVYPLSERGKLGSPLLIPHPKKRPEACSPEASGFIVHHDLSVTPYLETASGQAIQTSGVSARLIVGHGAPCLEAITARTRATPSLGAKVQDPNAIPLILRNADSVGTGVSCSVSEPEPEGLSL